MKTRLWQVSVTTLIEAEDAVIEFVECLFAQPPSVYIAADSQTAAVSVHCPKLPRPAAELRATLRTGLKRIRRCGLKIGPARITIRKVRRQDWAESWKKHFPPLEIGRALLIVPSWSRRRPRAGQAVVVLDPGLSFGTGQHPTTAFCLEQIVARRQMGRRQSFLDIGTGSGILAIAAATLGYRPVQAFDLDPAAVRAARANARRNRVTKRVRVFLQDLIRMPLRSETKFDLICANLIDDLVVGQLRRLLNRLAPRGALILAGILGTQFTRVHLAYAAAGLELIAMRQEKEWQSGAFAFPR